MRARVPMASHRSGHGSEQGSGHESLHRPSVALSFGAGQVSFWSAERRLASTIPRKGDWIDRDCRRLPPVRPLPI